MKNNTGTTTRSRKAAAAEAAPMALPEQTEAGSVRAAILAASTPAEWRAAANRASNFTEAADASAWEQTLLGVRSMGEAMYGEYKATLLLADSNAIVPAASEVTFTTIMTKLHGVNKAAYEALDADKRPGAGKRSWSSLAEAYDCWRITAADVWLSAYEASRGDAKRGTKAYTTFYKAAEAEAERATEAGETSQMRSARTKRERAAAEAAEVQRQADAAAKRESDRKAAADKAAAAERDAAQAVVSHVADHPAANLVPGVNLSNAEAAALSSATLRTLAAACLALADAADKAAADKAAADKAANKQPSTADTVADGQAAAQAALAAHDTEAEAAALGAAAEAADKPSLGALLARNPEAADKLADLLAGLLAG